MSSGSEPKLSRILLGRSDIPGCPGYELRLYLMKAEPGFSAPPHKHPGVGLGVVLSGSYESRYAGEAARVFSAMEGIYDLENVHHLVAKNASETEALEFVMAFVVGKDEPDVLPL